MTHVLEDLTHKMEGQPPYLEKGYQVTVSWFLGNIHSYRIPRPTAWPWKRNAKSSFSVSKNWDLKECF